MKRALKGFTLAEVLITLGIVGVVAAMTLPTLTTQTARAKTGPALAKAIMTLENANKMILSDNGARNLGTACGTNYLPCLIGVVDGSVLNATDFKRLLDTAGENYNTYRMNDGSSYTALGNPNAAFVLNDGSALIHSQKTVQSIEAPTPYDGRYYPVYIDINGINTKPNILGEDLFFIIVDYNGAVIPYGGQEFTAWNPQAGILWDTDDWRCDETKVVKDARACAGYIADHNWKAEKMK